MASEHKATYVDDYVCTSPYPRKVAGVWVFCDRPPKHETLHHWENSSGTTHLYWHNHGDSDMVTWVPNEDSLEAAGQDDEAS